MKKSLFLLGLIFPAILFPMFAGIKKIKKAPAVTISQSFKRIEPNGPALKDISRIKIYTGVAITIELMDLEKNEPQVRYYNGNFSNIAKGKQLVTHIATKNQELGQLKKFSDIEETLKKYNSVVIYFDKNNQMKAYMLLDFRLGYGDPKFEGVMRRIHLNNVQDVLINRCKQDIANVDLTYDVLHEKIMKQIRSE